MTTPARHPARAPSQGAPFPTRQRLGEYEPHGQDAGFNDSARKSLERGVDALANAVIGDLGPKGRNVVIDKKWGAPRSPTTG